jgi:tetratricopeptide (TPR) repeat protein
MNEARTDSDSKLPTRSSTLEVAISAFSVGRLGEAEDICREILGKDEKCAWAWSLMARMAALNGDLETAGDFASVACELEPGNAEFARGVGEVFLQRKEIKQAEAQARRALELEAESPEGLVLLGRVLAEKGEQGNALEAFERALRLRKDDAEAISHYAMALQKFGRGKEAVSQIRKACALEPESVEHQTNLATILEQEKRYVDALAAYGKAARMNPDIGYVWFRQGKLLNGLKRYAESIPMLEKAVSLPGRMGEFHYELGLALHMSKRFPEALDQYGQALAAGYNTAALQCNRGVIFKELRRGGDSIMAFHNAVKMDPSNLSYLNNLGAAALEIGLNSEASEPENRHGAKQHWQLAQRPCAGHGRAPALPQVDGVGSVEFGHAKQLSALPHVSLGNGSEVGLRGASEMGPRQDEKNAAGVQVQAEVARLEAPCGFSLRRPLSPPCGAFHRAALPRIRQGAFRICRVWRPAEIGRVFGTIRQASRSLARDLQPHR